MKGPLFFLFAGFSVATFSQNFCDLHGYDFDNDLVHRDSISSYKETQFKTIKTPGVSNEAQNYRTNEYFTFNFDTKGRVTSYQRVYTLDNPPSTHKSIIVFDELGRPKKHSHIRPKMTTADSWEDYTYDSVEKTVTKKKYESKVLAGKEVYLLNGDSLISEQKTYNTGGVHVWTSLFTYDTNKNLIQEIMQTSAGVLSQKRTYSYDVGNHVKERKDYDETGKNTQTFQYTYNTNGHVVSEVFLYGANKRVTTYSYEYDAHGNWTTRYMEESGVIYKLAREFTYR